jgi:phospholipid/cholesterol/gamma-HCH transport system substrate-binding protein
VARIDAIAADIRALSGGADARVQAILGNLEAASSEARALVQSAKDEVAATGDKVREKLDLVDQVIASTASITDKIDQDRGTLGRLVNDPTIADNVEEITDDAKGFLGTLFKMQTYVGLRSEYNVFAGLARHYMSVELHTRPDKFYLIELERGPRGGYPDTHAGVRPDQRRRPVGAHERRSPTTSASRSSSPSASTG